MNRESIEKLRPAKGSSKAAPRESVEKLRPAKGSSKDAPRESVEKLRPAKGSSKVARSLGSGVERELQVLDQKRVVKNGPYDLVHSVCP